MTVLQFNVIKIYGDALDKYHFHCCLSLSACQPSCEIFFDILVGSMHTE